MNESAQNLLGLPRTRLAEALEPWMDRPFRARQIYEAIHSRRVLSFAQMTDLPRTLRETLAARFELALPQVRERSESPDGTTKYLLSLEDGATIEAVDIPDRDRRTFCVSSQAGCALGCRFCVTGFWGAGRNLTAAEIVGQVMRLEQEAGLESPPNLVFMGMGEPLLNLEALHGAIEILAERTSLRRITVSTAGHLPGLEALGHWPRRPSLAVSLHAPDDARRSELMPINRVYPLGELLAALERYPLEPRRRITVEYLLLADFNDSLGDAELLSRRLRRLRVKVNLIPFNPDPVLPDWMRPPRRERVEAFRDRLESLGLTATIRRRRGFEVAAACGQLRAPGRDPRGFRGQPPFSSSTSQTEATLRPQPAPSRR